MRTKFVAFALSFARFLHTDIASHKCTTYDFSVQDTACTRPLGTDAVFGGTRTRETRPDAWAHTPSSPHLAPIDGPEYGLMQDLMIAHVDAVHAWPSLEFLTSDVADASVAQHGFGATPAWMNRPRPTMMLSYSHGESCR